MSKSQLRLLCAQATSDFLAKGKTITKCPARRHGQGFPVRNPHRTMPRWMFAQIASTLV